MLVYNKSTELAFQALDAKFDLITVKLDRVRIQVERQYQILIDEKILNRDENETHESMVNKLNKHRDFLNKNIETEMVRSLNRVKLGEIKLETKTKEELNKHLFHFKKEIEDTQLDSNFQNLLVGECVFGKFSKPRYGHVQFSKYNTFLNLNDLVLNPKFLVRIKLNLKPIDFYFLGNEKFVFRYLDNQGNNVIAIADNHANILYSKLFADPLYNYFSMILNNKQDHVCVLYNKSKRISLEIFDLRLNLLVTYLLTKPKLKNIQDRRSRDSFVWNFSLNRSDELLVSYRLEVNDLYYVLYGLNEKNVTIKSIICNKSLEFVCNIYSDKKLPVNRTSCLIYFTNEFLFFINHDLDYNRYLEIMYRGETGDDDSKNLVLIKQLKLDDSYELFFEPKEKNFIAYTVEQSNAKGNMNNLSNENDVREVFKFYQYNFYGRCVYENSRAESLYDLIKFDHFKVYFKNDLNIGLANLFREYFSSKFF